MDEFCVYILYSEKSNRLYTGYSANSIIRFYNHNLIAKKGFTIRHRPWKMIYCEFFTTKHEAMKREKELKSGAGRQQIRNEILKNMFEIDFVKNNLFQ